MNIEALKTRFKLMALSVIQFAQQLPDTVAYRTVRSQLIRSATSSAANYRSACRGKSTKDFIAKMGIVEEELD